MGVAPRGTAAVPDEPLIWTTRGNLPVASLAYATRWEVVPGEFVKFVETHTTTDGEVVRESAHVLALRPLTSEAAAQPL